MVPADLSQCGATRKRVVSCDTDKLSDEEYILKRRRNNDAVNRTRQKKRREETDTVLRVEHLRKENIELEKKVEGLQKELSFLKEMFIAYATSGRSNSSADEEKNEASTTSCSSGMSEEEQGRFASVVAQCVKTSTELLNVAKGFCTELQKEEERDGISFYEVKNHDLLAYTRDLVYLMYRMSIGDSIQGDPAVERLVYLRTVLERMRPIELKLKSYVEKLMSVASDVANSGTKILRPHPERLTMDDEGDEDGELESKDSNDDVSMETKSKKYVPPKLVAVHYNEDEEEVEERKMDRARRRAMQSSLIQDLQAQYSEAPEEFRDDSIVRKKKQEDVEKQKYEEDYLIRLQMTKKAKHNKKIHDRQNILDELLHFGNYMAVKDSKKGVDDTAGGRSNGKRRKVSKNGKFAKKSRRAAAKGKKGKTKSRKK
ncbi:unnamed protein product [Litomosoides sigmodontis]|uniref:BZIP domain-containing protein n=1 Tax=Litomosoides sigmodontis TaxID=42156 RepID=A0A3P6TGP1_LITSI|nr:unnamed protein product [Litomosoides sigmodontis]